MANIVVASDSPNYDSRGNCNAIIKTATNTLIAGCKKTVIPNSVTSIGSYAFSVCSGLTNLTLPNSVQSIGNHAFDGCSSLTSVTIPNSVSSIGEYAFRGCSGLTSLTIPNSVTSISDYEFAHCSGLTSVIIPNSVTSIGSSAFYGCSGLTTISIPNSIIQIGEYAFSNTLWLNNQPDGVVYAGKVAYTYKGDMPPNTSITINNSCHTIANGCFWGCPGLESVTIPNSVTVIGRSAFWSCSGLTTISIPNSVIQIGEYAFSNTPWLNNQPDGVVYAGKVAYTYKGTMPPNTNITINNSCHTITNYCFYGLKNLTSVTIPNSVKFIFQDAFSGCSGLTSVTIPNSVSSIGEYAFYGCSGLTSVTIPNSVSSIGNNAFYGCSSLLIIDSDIVHPKQVTTGNYIFDGVPKDLCTLNVPYSSFSEYQTTSPWNEFNSIAKAMRLRADTIHYVRGTSNTIVELPIELLNYKAISGLQFDLTLADQMTFNLRNGVPDIWLEDSRKARNHTVAVELQDNYNNRYRVLVSSQTSLPLKGSSGVLLHANMQINKYGTAGLFPIRYSNITMAAPDETPYYQDAWSSYLSYEYIVGDANADAHVNVGDFGVTANKILGREVNSLYFSDAANVNQDGVVDVVDLVGIDNISLGIRPQEIRRLRGLTPTPADGTGEPSLRGGEGSCRMLITPIAEQSQIAIALNNAVALAGLQMDIVLPQGVTIKKAHLSGRAAGHDLQMATLPDGRVRLLVASFSDKNIVAGDDEILTLTLSDNANGVVTFSDIVAAERNLTSHELDEVCVPLGTTGIYGMASYNEVRIYAQNGNIVIDSPAAGTAQLVQLNGITRPLKVQVGRNVYPAEPGYYIVRMAGVTAKIKI